MAVKAQAKITLSRVNDGSNGKDGKMLYGVCNTAATTAEKIPASPINGFSLYNGVAVSIKFAYANTAVNPTLNINGTGAKQIRLNGANSVYWAAGATVAFVYDGSYWQVCNTPLYGSTATIGNPGGGNVYVDGTSIKIRYGNTVLATYEGNEIRLGENSAKSKLSLCGGSAEFVYYADQRNEVNLKSGNIRISSKASAESGSGSVPRVIVGGGDVTLGNGSGEVTLTELLKLRNRPSVKWRDFSNVNPSWTENGLNAGTTYVFIITVSALLNSGAYAQEVSLALNGVEIGSDGNYYKNQTAFMGLCSNGDRFSIGSYKNGGSFSRFLTRVAYIPVV